MGEIRDAFGNLIQTIIEVIVGNPITLAILILWAAAMFCIGVITSMRWTGRKLRARRQPKPNLMATWGSAPPVAPRDPSPQMPPPSEPFPLRWDKGPRDW